ncbi:ExsB family protein [Methanococcus maripaludis C5]|uniref:ExsB family protein n=1 Tax=Methanococcus maripaludis (strain C5 / ATCC BAA-1333) TaxID=402880 RepID=A4G0Y2_METM5|nr:7-cyano-7-deazaguanine synthase [Methanococcus maripaludis]ABO36116.1 ExsB family protein [Methanococcus maripaludis C5]
MDTEIKTSALESSKKALNSTFLKNEISKEIYEILLELHEVRNKGFDEFLSYLKSDISNQNLKKEKAVVAFSGGVDSTASIIAGKKIFEICAVTVRSKYIMDAKTEQNVSELARLLNVSHEFIDVNLDSIFEDTKSGKYHPCGRCHSTVEAEILNYAEKNGIKYIIYGDMLSIGHLSVKKVDKGIIRLNILSVLSMAKDESRTTLKEFKININQSYGCQLIRKAHKHKSMQKFTIQRILREVRAQVITPEEGLKNILDVVKI